MKIPFYIKIVLSFVLFSLILLFLFIGIFKNFYEKDFNKKQTETSLHALNKKELILNQDLAKVGQQIFSLYESKLIRFYMQNEENEAIIIELFKMLMKSNSDILQIKILTLSGKEMVRVNSNNAVIEATQKEELGNQILQECCKDIKALKRGELWISSIEINKNRGEITQPVKFVIRMVVKTQKGFITIVLDAQTILEKMQNNSEVKSYIMDNEGNFLLHQNPLYNWSKYFAPNQTLHSLYSSESKSILEFHNHITESFASKRIYYNNQDYIIVVIPFKTSYYQEYIEVFEEYFITLLLGGITALILSFIFSKPIAKLNNKTEKENRNLDLTIKKNTEELLESLSIIDKHVMSIRMDKEGIITELSSAFCDFSGFLREELLGHHHRALVHPDMLNKEYDILWEKLNQGKAFVVELKGIKKDGSFYWVKSNIDPTFDNDGDIVGFNAIRNNITDKKVIENLYSDINYQVQQYNAIFQNANSGIGLMDLEGNFKKVNVVFSELLGYSSSELLQMSCFTIIQDSSKNFLRKVFVEAKEIGSISNIEKIFTHKDGTPIHLEMSLNLLPDKSYFVVVVNSLQDKRKLQELNQNLELKIQEEVQKSRLKDKIHQEEQLENIKLKSIGSLAAGITHEINTPLTYIKGNFEMMQYDIDDLPSSEIKTRMIEDSNRIKEGINRIANIVESMREISQSSNEVKEKVNIYSTIITALTMTYNRSKQVSRIYLNTKLFNIDEINKNELQFICEVQKQRIEQVWIVIINNALDELAKIADYEKRELNIFLKEEQEEIVITFHDNAGGIQPAILTTLFEPFISSKTHSGMGVGLNISKKIIEQQNGKIIAFNQDDGAVFEVRLKKCE